MSYEATPPPDPYRQQVPGYPPPSLPIPYASWLQRVAGRLLDGLFGLLASLPILIGLAVLFGTATYTKTVDANGTEVQEMHLSHGGATAGIILIGFGAIFVIAFEIWNVFVRQGTTGYSLGKSVVGIKLIKESTGRPIGTGWAFLREILHVVDGALFYLGWLWPIWDRRRQTFADKIVETVVIQQRPQR